MNNNLSNHKLTQAVTNELKNNAFVLTFDESGKMVLKLIESEYYLLKIEHILELINDDLIVDLDFSFKILDILNEKINRLS